MHRPHFQVVERRDSDPNIHDLIALIAGRHHIRVSTPEAPRRGVLPAIADNARPALTTIGHSAVMACSGQLFAASVAAGGSDQLNAIALKATKAEKELEWKPMVDLAEGIKLGFP
jgi:hypothetical protein